MEYKKRTQYFFHWPSIFDAIKIFNEKRLFATRETSSVKWLKFPREYLRRRK